MATIVNQMDPHAVGACLPWVCNGGRRKEGKRKARGRCHLYHYHQRRLAVLLAAFTHSLHPHPPLPHPQSLTEVHSQRNYAKSSTRKIRDTTSRRVRTSTCCIAISRNLYARAPLRDVPETSGPRSRSMKGERFHWRLRGRGTDRWIRRGPFDVSRHGRVNI